MKFVVMFLAKMQRLIGLAKIAYKRFKRRRPWDLENRERPGQPEKSEGGESRCLLDQNSTQTEQELVVRLAVPLTKRWGLQKEQEINLYT